MFKRNLTYSHLLNIFNALLKIPKHVFEPPEFVIMGKEKDGKSTALNNIMWEHKDNKPLPKTAHLLPTQEDFSTAYGQQYPVSTAQSALDKKMLEYRLQLSNGQHINPPPINVTVKGPNFDNLALTDTPGIVKSASSKEDQIKNKVFSDIIKETVNETRSAVNGDVITNFVAKELEHIKTTFLENQGVVQDPNLAQSFQSKFLIMFKTTTTTIIEKLFEKKKKNHSIGVNPIHANSYREKEIFDELRKSLLAYTFGEENNERDTIFTVIVSILTKGFFNLSSKSQHRTTVDKLYKQCEEAKMIFYRNTIGKTASHMKEFLKTLIASYECESIKEQWSWGAITTTLTKMQSRTGWDGNKQLHLDLCDSILNTEFKENTKGLSMYIAIKFTTKILDGLDDYMKDQFMSDKNLERSKLIAEQNALAAIIDSWENIENYCSQQRQKPVEKPQPTKPVSYMLFSSDYNTVDVAMNSMVDEEPDVKELVEICVGNITKYAELLK
nr:unnamed protein product [Naegleria fowleri]